MASTPVLAGEQVSRAPEAGTEAAGDSASGEQRHRSGRKRRRRHRSRSERDDAVLVERTSGSRRRNKHRTRRWIIRAMFQVTSMAMLAFAVYAMCTDSGLRKPGTEDTPGDPPTAYFYEALLAGAGSLGCFVASLQIGKPRRRWFARPGRRRRGSAGGTSAGQPRRHWPGADAGSARPAGIDHSPASIGSRREDVATENEELRVLVERWHELSPEARRLISAMVRESLERNPPRRSNHLG